MNELLDWYVGLNLESPVPSNRRIPVRMGGEFEKDRHGSRDLENNLKADSDQHSPLFPR